SRSAWGILRCKESLSFGAHSLHQPGGEIFEGGMRLGFKAYLISEADGKTISRFTDMDEAQLDPGEVTIRVAYSSVNYKDALAATGAGKIIRRFPCIGGIDLAGTVMKSADARFAVGEAVICTGYDVGVAH